MNTKKSVFEERKIVMKKPVCGNCYLGYVRGQCVNPDDCIKQDTRKRSAKRISSGNYVYRGHELHFHGWYPPDKCVWWEAVDKDGGASFHAHTKRHLMELIDEDLDDEKQN